MQKNTNIRTSVKRRGIPSMLTDMYTFSLYPRLLLETFLRRNFGKNYYSFRKALVIAVLLFVAFLLASFQVVPFLYTLVWEQKLYHFEPDPHFDLHYISWVVFLAAFLVFAVIRKIEAARNKGFTLSMGELLPFFYKLKLRGKPLSFRIIETFGEPLLCFLIGFLLFKLEQYIGVVIMLSSVFYSISYLYAYWSADEMIEKTHDSKATAELHREITFPKTKQQPEVPDIEDVL